MALIIIGLCVYKRRQRKTPPSRLRRRNRDGSDLASYTQTKTDSAYRPYSLAEKNSLMSGTDVSASEGRTLTPLRAPSADAATAMGEYSPYANFRAGNAYVEQPPGIVATTIRPTPQNYTPPDHSRQFSSESTTTPLLSDSTAQSVIARPPLAPNRPTNTSGPTHELRMSSASTSTTTSSLYNSRYTTYPPEKSQPIVLSYEERPSSVVENTHSGSMSRPINSSQSSYTSIPASPRTPSTISDTTGIMKISGRTEPSRQASSSSVAPPAGVIQSTVFVSPSSFNHGGNVAGTLLCSFSFLLLAHSMSFA